MAKVYCNISEDSRNVIISTDSSQDYGFTKFSSYVLSTCSDSYKYLNEEKILISLVDFLSLYQHLSYYTQ